MRMPNWWHVLKGLAEVCWNVVQVAVVLLLSPIWVTAVLIIIAIEWLENLGSGKAA